MLSFPNVTKTHAYHRKSFAKKKKLIAPLYTHASSWWNSLLSFEQLDCRDYGCPTKGAKPVLHKMTATLNPPTFASTAPWNYTTQIWENTTSFDSLGCGIAIRGMQANQLGARKAQRSERHPDNEAGEAFPRIQPSRSLHYSPEARQQPATSKNHHMV